MSNNPTPPRIEREAQKHSWIDQTVYNKVKYESYVLAATAEYNRAAPVVKALERLFRLHREFLDADEVKEIEQLIQTYKSDV